MSLLPDSKIINATPNEIRRYIDANGLRQLLNQWRIHWNLRPATDLDYDSKTTLSNYTGSMHNNGFMQKMEIKKYSDNDSTHGYIGIHIDGGESGIPHHIQRVLDGVSKESFNENMMRGMFGCFEKSMGKVTGHGLDDDHEPSVHTDNRMAAYVLDSYDGRIYLYTNDPVRYANNESSTRPVPHRTAARIVDIPTSIGQLTNDIGFLVDTDYSGTENNYSDSSRFLVDNMDDRTFVYPEISRDRRGDFITNRRVGLDGGHSYGESDGITSTNTQPDLGENPDIGDYGDRLGESVNSINHGAGFSGVNHPSGFFRGIFRSIEELERVDLIDQKVDVRTHPNSPGGRRESNYYKHDGLGSRLWAQLEHDKSFNLTNNQHPSNMEIDMSEREPIPYAALEQMDDTFNRNENIYMWRYNRIDVTFPVNELTITVVNPGEGYEVGDVLRFNFLSESISVKVTEVGSIASGDITAIELLESDKILKKDPNTFGHGIDFQNITSSGRGALFSIRSVARIRSVATQIKNNLYAYVDVVTSVRSDNSTLWSDVREADSQNGQINIRSTAAGIGYTGINSGRGGPSPSRYSTETTYHEHGGNATAGTQVHLFRYVINTEKPTFVVRDGIEIYTGMWVDQGPISAMRPCDVKALMLANNDTNNFNNYYKFNNDILFDHLHRNPDGFTTRNENTVSLLFTRVDNSDPSPNKRFTSKRVNPDTNIIEDFDITDKVLWINLPKGRGWMFNTSAKFNEITGDNFRDIGWQVVFGDR